MFFFLCGPHCCGKTSILSILESEGYISARGSEIGKDLFYKRSFQTESQNSDFEFEVTRLELERDRYFHNTPGVIGIETWHPGNLAYASVRNPKSIKELAELSRQSPIIMNISGIWLRIPKCEIIARSKTFKDNKEWAGEFYEKVDQNMEMCLKELGLLERTTIIDANRPFESVLTDVKNHLYILLK
ncbi:MAG TPA: hypothetical protein VHT96_08835 [Clostridia bacterium]|nr:hypothetical protein [Clostridia bacterium]